jgi:hypothetical protein
MRWNSMLGRLMVLVIVVVLVAMAMAAWRAHQVAQLRTQQQHELELMKQGGVEFMQHIGNPADAMKQTGDPFGPTANRQAPKKAKEGRP